MLSTMIESDAKADPAQMTVSTKTWPRAHLSQRSLSNLQYRIQLERAIKMAKQNLSSREGQCQEEENSSSSRRITRKLLKALESIRDKGNEQMLAKAGRRPRRRESTATVNNKNEPHFGSMILVGTLQREQAKALQRGMALQKELRGDSLRRQSISILSDDVPTEAEEVLPEQLAEEFVAAEETPLLRFCPLITSLFCAGLLLFLGALFFRAIDAQIASQPFHRALLFTYQAAGTIGWGDLRASNPWSQAFCALFTIFGVPIFFSALANLGRFISPFYTIDWLFLTCVIRPPGDNEPVVQQHVPVRKTLYLLCIHQLVGLLLYGGLIQEYPPVSVVYFCITSMATIGIGDIHPDAANLAEALVAVVFLGIGMILLAALLIAIAYHFQTLFFVNLRGWLLKKVNERK